MRAPFLPTPSTDLLAMTLPWNRMPPVFGKLLSDLLEDRRWSQRHFAELVGTSHTTVRRIIDGERGPDPEDIDRWADRLQLDGSQREAFLLSARSARAKGKSDSTDYIAGLEEKLADLTARLEVAEKSQEDAINALALAGSLLDLTLDLLRQRGVEVPDSVAKAAARVREKVAAMG